MSRPTKRKGRTPASPKERAEQLLRRVDELAQAEAAYKPLIRDLLDLHTDRMKENEFATRVDPDLLPELVRILEEEIRPEKKRLAEEYVRLFGFEWNDRVRISNPQARPVELLPYDLFCSSPAEPIPFGWLHGYIVKLNGIPGGRITQAKMELGVTTVQVLIPGGGPR